MSSEKRRITHYSLEMVTGAQYKFDAELFRNYIYALMEKPREERIENLQKQNKALLISSVDDFIPIISEEWFKESLRTKSPLETRSGIKVEFVVNPIGDTIQSSLCKKSANIFSNFVCSSLTPISLAKPLRQEPLFCKVSIIIGVTVS